MTEEELQKLQEDVKAAKAANAFLYLALESLGNIVFDTPALAATKARDPEMHQQVVEQFQENVRELNEALAAAHKWIWDENGDFR